MDNKGLKRTITVIGVIWFAYLVNLPIIFAILIIFLMW